MNKQRLVAFLFVLPCMLLAACQSIPNLSSWDRSTRDLGTAVAQGFDAAASVNADIGNRLKNVDDKDLAAYGERYSSAARDLTKSSQTYEQVFGAMADYSASLAAIAAASANSSNTVDAVSGTLNQLVSVVGATPLAGAGFELVKLFASEAIKVKAASDFSSAVRAADPVVEAVCTLLKNDLASLRKTLEFKDETIIATYSLPYDDRLEYRTALMKRRAALQKTIRNAATNESLSSVPETSEIQKVDLLLRDIDSWYVPFRQEVDQKLAARAKSEELIVQTIRAVDAWRASHASLAAAAQAKRLPEAAYLATLAIRIRELGTDIRKGK
ncbi:hypothetical protein [Variovorax rhizosphaerae]|uniref:DUF3829 domain-containing protein n=1 Tax=Variovorax rhizosphaerae TaxID=1836200 RepID=A0ABU8WPT7_9BURK